MTSHAMETTRLPNQRPSSSSVPWQKIGTSVGRGTKTREILRRAHLDWSVKKIPLSGRDEGKTIETTASALIRDTDKRFFSLITEDCKPVQNDEALDCFRAIIEAVGGQFHTLGEFKDGEMIWFLGSVPNLSFSIGEDKVAAYLLFSNPHVYGKAADVRLLPMREANGSTVTMYLPEKSDRDRAIRILGDYRAKPELLKAEASEISKLAQHHMARFEKFAKTLSAKKYTPENLHRYFSDVFPSMSRRAGTEDSRAVKSAMEIVENPAHGASYSPQSWWNAFNTVLYLQDHVLGHNDETRIYSSWYGPNRNRKLDALRLALDYATKGTAK